MILGLSMKARMGFVQVHSNYTKNHICHAEFCIPASAEGVFRRHAFCFSRKAVAKPITAPLPEHPLSGHPSAGGYACRWFVQLHEPTRSESEGKPMTKAKRRGRRADCRPR